MISANVPADRARRPSAVSQNGLTLIEVMVAIALLTILLVPLWQVALALSSRAGRLDTRLASLSDIANSSSAKQAQSWWTWGSRLGRAWWEPGPELRVDLRGSGTDGATLVGLWVGGWFEGEMEVGSGRQATVGSRGRWIQSPGSEVVIRTRSEGGSWGAPWRTLVPDPTLTSTQVPSEPSSPTVGTLADPTGCGLAAVHLSTAGLSTLTLARAGLDETLSTTMTPGLAEGLGAGPVQVTFAKATQAWKEDRGRVLDLYF